jgi:phospholipid/cholesterol/gamma-HCH transport system substrate-binding protein
VNIAGVEVGADLERQARGRQGDRRHADRAQVRAGLQGRDRAAAAQDRPEGHGGRAEPGTKAAGRCPRASRIPISQTLPDVNLDEILASLDADTRDYLRLLLSDGATALGRNGRELAQAIRPHRADREVRARDQRALAVRRRNSSASSTTSRC